MTQKEVYLDYAATTPIDPRVLESMMPYLSHEFGNPSSLHQFGQRARHALDASREKISSLIGAKPADIIFTSGGTEANNLFIKGVAELASHETPPHIITTQIEHESVLKPIQELEKKGFEVTYLGVGGDGLIDPEDLKKALRPETLFVSIIYANNEIGTIQPIEVCSEIVKSYKGEIFFHTDACQAAAYLSLNVDELGVDAMTINAGKIYGPKGAGALYVRGGAHGKIKLMPQLLGGGQEYRMRSGTENVAGIVGFATALEIAQKNRETENERLTLLRNKLIDGILCIPDTRLNGSREKRLPNNVNISFKGLHGEAILVRLDMVGIAASSGSACSSGSLEASHVITALSKNEKDDVWSRSATRFTLGKGTTESDIDFVLKELPTIIAELSEINPFK